MSMFRGKRKAPLKFEVSVTVLSMENLPSKYKHLRLSITRGAKAVSTKELFAVNCKAQPTAVDGTMKMISTMYKSGDNVQQFEEKMYKLSLIRINPRAMREREKKIGNSYINMADFVSPDPVGVSEEMKVTMKVSEGSSPAELTLSIKSQWLRNYKGPDGDAMSDMTGMSMETSSIATTNTSLNSVDEEDELELEDDHDAVKDDEERSRTNAGLDDSDILVPRNGFENMDGKAQAKRGGGGSGGGNRALLSPTAEAAVSGDVQALRAALMEARSEAKRSNDELRERERQLAAKEELLKECRADIARLEGDLEGALRVQEELMEENERAEAEYEKLLNEVEAGASQSQVDASHLDKLRKEVERLKGEATALKAERDDLRERASLAERQEAEAANKANVASKGAEKVAELEAALEREKGKTIKFKGWLEKMTEQKASVESEIAKVREQLAEAETANRKEFTTNAGAGGADQDSEKEELNKMAAEVERISMQLVTASLGHAQAEQDRLEAKQQVYKLKESNRKLRERLSQAELELVKAH